MSRTRPRVRWWWVIGAAVAAGVIGGLLVAVVAFPDSVPDRPTAFGATDVARLQDALTSGDPASVTAAVELPSGATASDELVRGLSGLAPRIDPDTILGQDGGAATVEADGGDGTRWLLLVRPSQSGWRLASTVPLS